MNRKFETVEQYFDVIPEVSRQMMEQIRQVVKSVVHDATDVISYNMPAFRFHGILIYYAAHKEHIGFYPANAKLIREFSEHLKDFHTSKGAIQFPTNKPLPVELIKMMIEERVKENLAKRK